MNTYGPWTLTFYFNWHGSRSSFKLSVHYQNSVATSLPQIWSPGGNFLKNFEKSKSSFAFSKISKHNLLKHRTKQWINSVIMWHGFSRKLWVISYVTWRKFGGNPRHSMSFIHVLFVFHAGTWHGFRTSSSHGISMIFYIF